MSRLWGVIRRHDYGIQAVLPLVVCGVAWWMGWSVFVASGACVAAAIVTAIVRRRRPGRWTE